MSTALKNILITPSNKYESYIVRCLNHSQAIHCVNIACRRHNIIVGRRFLSDRDCKIYPSTVEVNYNKYCK